jgi:hypothetical protein
MLLSELPRKGLRGSSENTPSRRFVKKGVKKGRAASPGKLGLSG